MTLSHVKYKRIIDAPKPISKRQKTDPVAERIEEMLRNPKTRSRCRDLFIRWNIMEDRKAPVQLEQEPISRKSVPFSEGDTLLHLALRTDDYALIKGVLDFKEPNFSAKNVRGQNAIHLAAQTTQTKVHLLFIKRKVKDEQDNAFLHYYFNQHAGKYLNFHLLTPANPDLTLENFSKTPCYEVAADNYHRKDFREMMRYMQEKRQTILPEKLLSLRAQAYLNPPEAFPNHYLQYLSFTDLYTFRCLNRRTKKNAEHEIIDRIKLLIQEKKCDFKRANYHVNHLLNELQELEQNERLPFHTDKKPPEKLDAMLNPTIHEVCSFLSNVKHVFYPAHVNSDDEREYIDFDGEPSPFISYWNNRVSCIRLDQQPLDETLSAAAVRNLACYGPTALLKFLLEHGASVKTTLPKDCPNWPEEPGLHGAIERNDITAFSLLLEHGADANEINQETHWTPLEAATEKMNEAMIKILMQKLPDPNLHVISLTPP